MTEPIRVLEVLATQSPGYSCHPEASAFVAAGLPVDTVQPILDQHTANGYVEQGDDGGYSITDAGRAVAGLSG